MLVPALLPCDGPRCAAESCVAPDQRQVDPKAVQHRVTDFFSCSRQFPHAPIICQETRHLKYSKTAGRNVELAGGPCFGRSGQLPTPQE